MPAYAWISLNNQGSEYARVCNMPDIAYNLRPLYKVLSFYWDRLVQKAKMERSGRIIKYFDRSE